MADVVDEVCPRPRRRATPERLRQVADIYLAAPRRPRKAVMDQMGLTARTADRLVSLAREAGMLPPVGAGRAPVAAAPDPEDCWVCGEVAWLLDAGELREQVHTRLGYNDESLMRHLRRHDPALRTRYMNAVGQEDGW